MRKLTDGQRTLVERNLRLAWLAVWRTQSIRLAAKIEDEDAYMMACEGLARAATLYNPEKSAESSYLYPAALNMIRTECRNRNLRSQFYDELISLDQECSMSEFEDTVMLLDALPSRESTENTVILRESVREALEAMTKRERTCFLLSYGGMSQKEIGRRIGHAQAHVSRIIRQAREKSMRKLETE